MPEMERRGLKKKKPKLATDLNKRRCQVRFVDRRGRGEVRDDGFTVGIKYQTMTRTKLMDVVA
jgi:hypothetical protein